MQIHKEQEMQMLFKNKSIKRRALLVPIFVLFTVFFGLFFVQNTYASCTGPGCSGSGSSQSTDISKSANGSSPYTGVTWVYYAYTGTGGDLRVPSAGDQTVISGDCRRFGGFYFLAGPGYNFLRYGDTKNPNPAGYTGSVVASWQLRSLQGLGGNAVYKTNIPVSDTAGDATIVRYGEPLDVVQQKFLSMPEEAKMGFTWGPNSTLGWFCYGDEYAGTVSGGNVYSTSAVTYNGNTLVSDLDGTVNMIVPSTTVNSGSAVTFTHRIVSSEQPYSSLNINVSWSISGAGASSNNPPSGTTNLGASGGWTQRADGKWETVVSVSGMVGASGRVCQTITYSPKNYSVSNGTSGGRGSSTACFNITAINYTPTCSLLGGVSAGNINYGNTNGASKVQNLNNITGDIGWQPSVWARPGDTVRFAHCFSWGVQAVRKSDNYGAGRTTPDAATGLSDRVEDSWFEISSDRGSQYLFGLRRDQGSMGSRITLNRAQAQNGVAYNGGNYIQAEQNGGYQLVLMSPTQQPVDYNRYNCLIFDFMQFINYGFQIPGFRTGENCSAASVTGQKNEAGNTISQRITFPSQFAWVHENYSGMHGSCNCGIYDTANDGYYLNYQNLGYPGGNGSVARTDNLIYQSRFGACTGRTCTGTDGVKCKGGYAPGCSCSNGLYRGENGQRCTHWDVDADGKKTDDCLNYEPVPSSDQNDTITCSGWTPVSLLLRHPVHYSYNGNATSVATVNIPYNFRTADTSAINAASTIYAGETVSSTFTASVLPVVNSSIKSTQSAYATVYPGDIRIEQFIIGPDRSLPANSKGVFPINGSMCNYFGGTQCGTIGVTGQDANWLNSQGRYNGWSWSMSATYNVPNNADIGSKYCVAIGMTIASSHPNAEAQTVSGMQNFNTNWRVSMSCRTIAKKPNLQAWNAGVYTEAGIETSVSRKFEGAILGTNSPADKIFGSWSEYLAISRGNITGFASGAALGYEGSNLRITGGHSAAGDFCDLSHMTISNIYCSYSVAGQSRINISDSVVNRIYARYTPASMSVNSGANINVSSATPLSQTTGQTTGEYIMTSGNGDINSTIIRGKNSPVLVINVPGTLNINANICSGGGACSGYDNTLILKNRNNQVFNDISDLPQVIIVAGNVNIGQNVTQVDAWIIASNVNTCREFNLGVSDLNTCSKTLIINGPIIADTVYPNRTAGAFTRSTFGANTADGASNNLSDDGSITPAEIFNYRPDTLLWSYSQAQDFSQATVTYSRELSPRY